MLEKEIIQNILGGNSESFELIVKKYNTTLKKVGLYYLFNKEEVDDVVQTTYLKAYENLHTFRGDASLKSWLIRIMINECKQNNRKGGLFRKFQNNMPEPDYFFEETSESKIISLEEKTQLEQAIDRLSPKYKSVFIRRLVVGSSTQDTADDLGISEETVKIRLFRAKKKLRHALLSVQAREHYYLSSAAG